MLKKPPLVILVATFSFFGAASFHSVEGSENEFVENDFVYVYLPSELCPDASQPTSVPTEGEWDTVGTVQLYGNQVYDPELDQEIDSQVVIASNLATNTVSLCTFGGESYCSQDYTDFMKNMSQHYSSATDLDIVSGCSDLPPLSSADYQGTQDTTIDSYYDLLSEHCEELLLLVAEKAEGYKLTRRQQYRSASTAGWTVQSYDTTTLTTQLTLGTQQQEGVAMSESTGWTFGTSTTDTSSTGMNGGLEFSGISLGAKTESSHEYTDSKDLSKALKVDHTDSTLSSSLFEVTIEFTMNGCAPGARYVMWQIVDELRLTPNYKCPDEEDVTECQAVSVTKVYSHTQTNKYYFGDCNEQGSPPSC